MPKLLKFQNPIEVIAKSLTETSIMPHPYIMYCKQGGILKAQPGNEVGEELVKSINSRSNANFVQRLKDPNRKTISLGKGKVGTHLMGYVTEDDHAVVFPQIQEINGKLRKLPIRKAINRAIATRDTLQMTVPQAEWFTTNYKNYYPTF